MTVYNNWCWLSHKYSQVYASRGRSAGPGVETFGFTWGNKNRANVPFAFLTVYAFSSELVKKAIGSFLLDCILNRDTSANLAPGGDLWPGSFSNGTTNELRTQNQYCVTCHQSHRYSLYMYCSRSVRARSEPSENEPSPNISRNAFASYLRLHSNEASCQCSGALKEGLQNVIHTEMYRLRERYMATRYSVFFAFYGYASRGRHIFYISAHIWSCKLPWNFRGFFCSDRLAFFHCLFHMSRNRNASK